MKCRFPPPLTDDHISAALDGVADQDVHDHLMRCAYCAARLAEARRIERGLHASLNRLDCPTPQQLGEYHLKLASRADARAIARHLKECLRCSDELAELQTYLGVNQPAGAAPQPARPSIGALGKLFGQLLPRAPAVALRGGAGPEPIIFEADGATIILDVLPAPNDHVTIQGQVVADDLAWWAGSLVELRQAGVLQATGTVNDLGGFSMGPISAAMSELRFAPQRGRILVLDKIPLGS